ncbi:MAG: hypothetical protein WCP34_12240 [Pseudomonadota bacterium]
MTGPSMSDQDRLVTELRGIVHDCRQPVGALGSLVTTLEMRLAANEIPGPEEWTLMTRRLRRICQDLSGRLDRFDPYLHPTPHA